MSVFLMGVYDEASNVFLTVTKCGNGHDDATLDRINKELQPRVGSLLIIVLLIFVLGELSEVGNCPG